MKLYEIDSAIEAICEEFDSRVAAEDFTDPETGEAIEPEQMLDRMVAAIEGLEMARDEKALNVACLVKSLRAEAEAYKSEEEKLAARRKTAERKAEWLKSYVAAAVPVGERLENARARIGWRKSEQVKLLVPDEMVPDEYQVASYRVDKALIKKRLKELGEEACGFGFAELVTNQNIQIS